MTDFVLSGAPIRIITHIENNGIRLASISQTNDTTVMFVTKCIHYIGSTYPHSLVILSQLTEALDEDLFQYF